jgi:hypothetical protein
VVAIASSLALVLFYVVLYFGGSTHFGVALPDVFPTARREAPLETKWLLYGALLLGRDVGGAVYYLRRHGNSRYNQLRIATNVAIQVGSRSRFPLALVALGKPDVLPELLLAAQVRRVLPLQRRRQARAPRRVLRRSFRDVRPCTIARRCSGRSLFETTVAARGT